MDLMIEHLGHGLILSLMLSMPAVLTAAGVGLVIGILQAVTQVQEQTIASAPKILFVFTLILLGGGLMIQMLSEYMRESAHLAFTEVPRMGDTILPPLSEEERARAMAQFFGGKPGAGGASTFESFRNQPSPGEESKNSGGGPVPVIKTPHNPNQIGIAEQIRRQKQSSGQ